VACVYLLKQAKPDLILLHFVDLDAVAHEAGPFEKEANHTLEVTDGYIGEIVKAAPKNALIVVLGDHGFERVDRDLNLSVFAKGMQMGMLGGLLTTRDAAVAAKWRDTGLLGREVPIDEVRKFEPGADVVAAFEPKRNEGFAMKPGAELYVPPYEKGNHGWWPGLSDYRAAMVMWGPGVKKGVTPAVPMESVAGRLAAILGVKLER